MLGLIKCRECDEDIEVYDAEKVIIHYSLCTKCKGTSSQTDPFQANFSLDDYLQDH